MTTSASNAHSAPDWIGANQHVLTAELARLKTLLNAGDSETAANELAQARANLAHRGEPAAVDVLARVFSLSGFERDLLLLCAGVELASDFHDTVAQVSGTGRAAPTFSLGFAVLPNAHWSAATPTAPLRRWRLLEPDVGDGIMHRPLSIDERVLHYLTGVSYLDRRLQGLIVPVDGADSAAAYQPELVERLAALWSPDPHGERAPLVQLCGHRRSASTGIASQACASLGLTLHRISSADIPDSPAEREALARLWEREAALGNGAMLIDHDAVAGRELACFVGQTRGLIVLATDEPVELDTRRSVRLDVPAIDRVAQRRLWRVALGAQADMLNGQLDQLVSQFNVEPDLMHLAASDLAQQPPDTGAAGLGAALWRFCRSQSRRRLDALAQRLEPAACWEDLVLPETQRQNLREIAVHVRQRFRVYESWGFAEKSSRGLGMGVLFAGASGTGKTMAAEVLAGELDLDLYRIDLSGVVSKYIGETEKNLRRVFAAAEDSGAILLFDEADALFGKRSEVKDSHDRYANIEISYLLQRMEAYRGLAILTTNMKKALDTAFLRRIRFVVQFPFPDTGQRAEIWRRIFPAQTPVDGIDVRRLARLDIAGGNIRNIALHAAFLAADEGGSVTMRHLARAVRREYAKLEKPVNESEFRTWGR